MARFNKVSPYQKLSVLWLLAGSALFAFLVYRTASWQGATITEIPIKNISRRSGKSDYNISRTLRVLLDLISVKFLLDYSTRPLHFFGFFGLLGTLTGFGSAVFLLIKHFYYHVDIMDDHGPLLFLTVLLILSGIQFLSIGLLGEMLARTYYESQDKPIYAVREVRALRVKPMESVEHEERISSGAGKVRGRGAGA